MSRVLWWGGGRVGLMNRGMPSLLSVEPSIDRDGYADGKITVHLGTPHGAGIRCDANDLHALATAAKELILAKSRGPLTVEQHVRMKAGLPADPPPAETEETEELFA